MLSTSGILAGAAMLIGFASLVTWVEVVDPRATKITFTVAVITAAIACAGFITGFWLQVE